MQEHVHSQLSPNQVAAWLGVSESTINRLIKRGDLEATRIGKRCLRISRESVEAYLTNAKTREK